MADQPHPGEFFTINFNFWCIWNCAQFFLNKCQLKLLNQYQKLSTVKKTVLNQSCTMWIQIMNIFILETSEYQNFNSQVFRLWITKPPKRDTIILPRPLRFYYKTDPYYLKTGIWTQIRGPWLVWYSDPPLCNLKCCLFQDWETSPTRTKRGQRH